MTQPARMVHLASIVKKLKAIPYGMATAFDTPYMPETRKRLVIAVHGTISHHGQNGGYNWVSSYPITRIELIGLGEELIKEGAWPEEDFHAMIRDWTFCTMSNNLSGIPCLTNDQAWEVMAAMDELVHHHLDTRKLNKILDQVEWLE